MFSNRLIEKLQSAKSIAVLTGAGISAESGVPTFRGEQGLWKKFRPEELANFNAFIRNPELVWEWYNYRKKLIYEVVPNPGHHALVKMERHYPDFTLITQNVDNLHRVAGSRNILELHGNIMMNRCVDCNRLFKDQELSLGSEADLHVPRCSCGSLIRPNVVWFGEALPVRELQLAHETALRCDLFFSIGTSALVQPAASLPLEAKRANAYVVEINYEATAISHLVDESILGKSGEILPLLIEKIGIA
ncbi:NAD-dependent deacylase [candidate division KSB1 bacterium]|nr:NAD-dependent deacylase [candidate division KSB1 bacterium]